MSRGLFVGGLITIVACGGEAFEPASSAVEQPDAAEASTTAADFRGVYNVAVTARQNGCAFANWEEGKVTPNVGFTLAQVSSDVTGTIDGLTGTAVEWWLGTKTFVGNARGTTVSLTAYGTRQTTTDKGCAYTINATVEGTLTGDALQGSIRYTTHTNKSPACGVLEGCVTRQEFAGARPPSGK